MKWTSYARHHITQIERIIGEIFQVLSRSYPDPEQLSILFDQLIYHHSQFLAYRPYFEQYLLKKHQLSSVTEKIHDNIQLYTKHMQYLQALDESVSTLIQTYPLTSSKYLKNLMSPIDVHPVSLALDYNNINLDHLQNYEHMLSVQSSNPQNDQPTETSSLSSSPLPIQPNDSSSESFDLSLPKVPINYVLGLAKRLSSYRLPPESPFPNDIPNSTVKDAIQASQLRLTPAEILEKLQFQDPQ